MKPSVELLSPPLDSEHRQEIAKAEKEKPGVAYTLLNFVGFFAPFGTKNSFWKRLTKSPMFRHFFVHRGEGGSAVITVVDVDSAVNNCALICALLLGVPTGIMGTMGSSEDAWINLMRNGVGVDCPPMATSTGDVEFSPKCTDLFKSRSRFMFNWIIISFYSSLFTLITAVLYYMCRPSECYTDPDSEDNNTPSMDQLLEECTLEVRKKIRNERHKSGEESEKSPETPFSSCNEEMEVFLKAKFMAEHKGDGLNNLEFYKWYRSKMFCCFVPFFIIN